jgi:hypothetical protein
VLACAAACSAPPPLVTSGRNSLQDMTHHRNNASHPVLRGSGG